jgi:hypothetical protein
MADTKTRPTRASVARYLKERAKGQQLPDCRELIKLFKDLTGKQPKMWGPSIVGFGSYHYEYPSGHKGDAPLAGFAVRGRELVIYTMCARRKCKPLFAKLGKHRASVACLYVKSLDDIDRGVLRKIARASIAEVSKRYPA